VTVTGRGVLSDFIKRHGDVRGQVAAWLAEAEAAKWKSQQDVRARYPSVSFIGARAVFNLKGPKYRLVTTIAFNTGVVHVERMGTHAEYNKWKL
jgi:mRNA interferase HigB